MLNTTILIGRIVNDLEVKTSSSGVKFLNFSLAIPRRTNRDKTDFIPCTAFNKTAEVMAQYLEKGNLVNIEGSIQINSYEDKEGQKRQGINIIVDRMNFIQSQGSNSSKFNNQKPKIDVDNMKSSNNASKGTETEEKELKALFDDMDFFKE